MRKKIHNDLNNVIQRRIEIASVLKRAISSMLFQACYDLFNYDISYVL